MNRTPLFELYGEQTKLVDFGGWEMPLHFEGGILAEHEAVRTAVGLFDVSHMGECVVTGKEAGAYLDWLLTNRISDMEVGQCRYTMMCYPDGTVVDDILVYRRHSDSYMLVLNAANTKKDLDWITKDNPMAHQAPFVVDISDSTALLALQGPKAVELLSRFISDIDEMDSFTLRNQCEIDSILCLVSRTGYTGEDGFEIYCDRDDAPKLWNLLIEQGAAPCGLGARDTLRLEAKLPLYGQEISDSITPLEANLGAFVKFEKEDFCGKAALLEQKNAGVPRTLRGIEMVDKSVPRSGYPVFRDGSEIGYVTSGMKSPSKGIFFAMVLIDREPPLKFGDQLEVEIHKKLRKARLIRTPIYQRSNS
ncbi:MAG: glycine cleavage system aminomethyltransferase GcvT [Spirochaetales bacterium]|jgi:aminomethyltransferase|nr:glycine cleavage system aminomethyltransferase GcvT [Spirochaetales bacterium]